jgi:hypothetical protein
MLLVAACRDLTIQALPPHRVPQASRTPEIGFLGDFATNLDHTSDKLGLATGIS